MIYLISHISQFSESDFQAALPALSPCEREKCLAYKSLTQRLQSMLAALLLRRALREEHGITQFTIGHLPKGKPFLASHPHIHFNVSHCREAVAVAVHTAPVGIDVESPRRITPSLMAYAMSAQEIEQINAAPSPADAFIALWTRKEAYLKYTGQGLTRHLPQVLATATGVRFHTERHPRYTLTLCLPAPACRR